jgi:hypothetical protein
VVRGLLGDGDAAAELAAGVLKDRADICSLLRTCSILRSIPGSAMEFVAGMGEVGSDQSLVLCAANRARCYQSLLAFAFYRVQPHVLGAVTHQLSCFQFSHARCYQFQLPCFRCQTLTLCSFASFFVLYQVWSARLLTAYLLSQGAAAAMIDARQVLVVNAKDTTLGAKGAGENGFFLIYFLLQLTHLRMHACMHTHTHMPSLPLT